jgi:hypothetical protein
LNSSSRQVDVERRPARVGFLAVVHRSSALPNSPPASTLIAQWPTYRSS